MAHPALVALALLLVQGAPQEAPSDPAAARARELSLELTGAPRLAGTIGSAWGASVVARHLAAAGWEVEIDEREVLLSLPRRLELFAFEDGAATSPFLERRTRYDADAIPPGDVPLYSAWSASADVRAPLVDVGRGLRADYERLAAAGVDVEGAIALAQYGGAYRGVKVDLASEFGCVGVLLWSPPSSDGAERGDVWPAGPFKPDWAAQRGSIAPMGHVPGDPSTPGWASPRTGEEATGARRASDEEIAAVLPSIPCLPIGSGDALKLQAGLRELGPGPLEVRLDLDVPRELRAIQNVIARLPGTGPMAVVAGSHRDAWVRGAHDSGSGCVALLLVAEELGRRAREGWRPQHGLVLGFWDGEESGLIGSTEWAEAHAEWLRAHALAYVNADATVSGTRARGSGTPGMLGVLRSVLERVAPAPLDADAGHANLWEQWAARSGDEGPRLGLPGSGSDFAAFVHHLGIPMLEVGFGGNRGGQYHTAFDDFAVVDRFLDPGWQGHALAGRTLTELLATLAASPGAGFDAAEAAERMAELAESAGDADQPGGGWLDGERAQRLADAFTGLAQALRASRQGAAPDSTDNRFYRDLSAPDGLRGRTWFKNRLWTPGLETGYSAETFPSLRAAQLESEARLDGELDALLAALELLRAKTATALPRPGR